MSFTGKGPLTIAVALACAVAACYAPSLKDCFITCGPRNECPADLTCHGGLCSSGTQCNADGPSGDEEPGDLASDGSDVDAQPMPDADASEAPNKPVTLSSDASDGDSKETGDASDAGPRGDGPEAPDADGAVPDADGAAPDGNEAGAALVAATPPRCPPGVRLGLRTGRCQPMNDLNGDGLADGLGGFDTEFDALISDGSQFHRVDNWLNDGPWYSLVPSVPGVLTGDVNGDRITDVVTFATGGVSVLVLPGTGTGKIYDFFSNWANVPLHGKYFTYLADVSGDGKDDVIALNQGEADVAVSTGFSFAQQTTWATSDVSGYNGAYFADVDGDYCADAVTIGASTVDVRLSTKTAFAPPSAWLSVDLVNGDLIYIADADGDGRADYIRVRADATSVALSDGHSFGALQTWYTGPLAGSAKTFFVDVDGDGRADVVAVNDTSVEVALSTGDAFAAPTVWYDGRFLGTNWTNFAFEPAGSHPEP